VTEITKYAGFLPHTAARREEDSMTRRYFFRKPTVREQRSFQQVLLDQIQVQQWSVVLYVGLLDAEVLISLN
jgi:hypothetical protein